MNMPGIADIIAQMTSGGVSVQSSSGRITDHRGGKSGSYQGHWTPPPTLRSGIGQGTRVTPPQAQQPQGGPPGQPVVWDAQGNGYDANGNLVEPAGYGYGGYGPSQQTQPQAQPQPQYPPGVPVQCDAYGNCYDAYGNLVSYGQQAYAPAYGYGSQSWYQGPVPAQPGMPASTIDAAHGYDTSKYVSADDAAAHGEFYGYYMSGDFWDDVGNVISKSAGVIKEGAEIAGTVLGGAAVGQLAGKLVDAAAGDWGSQETINAIKAAAQTDPQVHQALQTATKAAKQSTVAHTIASGGGSYDTAIAMIAHES